MKDVKIGELYLKNSNFTIYQPSKKEELKMEIESMAEHVKNSIVTSQELKQFKRRKVKVVSGNCELYRHEGMMSIEETSAHVLIIKEKYLKRVDLAKQCEIFDDPSTSFIKNVYIYLNENSNYIVEDIMYEDV